MDCQAPEYVGSIGMSAAQGRMPDFPAPSCVFMSKAGHKPAGESSRHMEASYRRSWNIDK